MLKNVNYTLGTHSITDRVHAYLQPYGGWGRSNGGLIRGNDSALLVDTFFDAHLTRAMLAAYEPLTRETPIEVAVNTHGDGDHWYGNYELPAGVDIFASEGAVEDMKQLGPDALALLVAAELPQPTQDYIRAAFGAFAFADSNARLPSETFSGRMDLDVGGTAVELIEVGPAHTGGDVIVHVPGERTVFTGDILFIGGTPVAWEGPVSNWIRACDRVLELDAEHIVPGHGPLTDAEGVRGVQRYFTYLDHEARQRFDAGMDYFEAALDIDLGEFGGWLEPERVVVNVDRLYRAYDPERPLRNRAEMLVEMAKFKAARQAGEA